MVTGSGVCLLSWLRVTRQIWQPKVDSSNGSQKQEEQQKFFGKF